MLDGTWGNNAYLQGVDNMHGMMASGKAPAVQSLYDFGSNIHNILNPTKVDIAALGGPMVKGNVKEVNPIVESTINTQPTLTPVGTSATALSQIQANIEAAKMKEESPTGGSINQTKKTTASPVGMMSSGPPRRSSRAGRKKPAKTSYGRRYGL